MKFNESFFPGIGTDYASNEKDILDKWILEFSGFEAEESIEDQDNDIHEGTHEESGAPPEEIAPQSSLTYIPDRNDDEGPGRCPTRTRNRPAR